MPQPPWRRRPEKPSDGPPRRPHRSSRPSRSPSQGPRPQSSPHGTSWEKSADWYDRIIGAQGSELYQQIVIPKALELLCPQPSEKILDLGCGQGVFTRALADCGSHVTGIDAAPALIKRAKTYPSRTPVRYHVRDAADLRDLGPFDAACSILALQNMEHLPEVCRSTARVLRDGGRMLWVLNHPCFRIPRQTAWGWDEDRKIQFRRIDAYASPMSIPIVMHPGQTQSENTVSFHKGLTDLMACAFGAGFLLSGFEEWHSHKQSEPGPRAKAENRARDEFPLFLAMLWRTDQKEKNTNHRSPITDHRSPITDSR
jgi:SAM-dependent methyltransferase